jgi:two-component system sensor histidine kinase KdpD
MGPAEKGRKHMDLLRGRSVRRRAIALAIGAVLFTIVVPLCAALRSDLNSTDVLLLFLVIVVICAAVTGCYPVLIATVISSVLTNYMIVLQSHDLAIAGPESVVTLVVLAILPALAYERHQLTITAATLVPLADTDRARTALLRALSHDLRTPVATAKASVTSLRSAALVWSWHDQQELLTYADNALDQLTAMLSNLLDLSRLEAGVFPVTVAPTDLHIVLARLVVQTGYHERVQLHVPDGIPGALADAGLVERVVGNLVENALRYSPPDEPVVLTVSEFPQTVAIQVMDRGPGIAPDEREWVCDSFRRGRRQPATRPGVGLGLAIARDLTEAMSGVISFDDNPGGGLRAIVALPSICLSTDSGELAQQPPG